MVHNFMMPPKGKSTKTLQRAWEEGVRPGGWGRVLGYFHKNVDWAIFNGSNFEF